MNMPGFDPAAQAATGAARGPGAHRGGSGDGAPSPFARMIERGPERQPTAGDDRAAQQRPRDAARAGAREDGPVGAGDPARPAPMHEHERADETATDAAAANAAQPWPPQGLAALGLVVLAPAGTPQAAAGAELDADAAAAWAQLAATSADGDAEAAVAPAVPALPAREPLAPGVLATSAQMQPPAPQAAPVAAPVAAPAVEPLLLADAGGDGEAPPPSFLVAPATPVQAAREAPAALAPPPTPTPNLHGDDFAEAVGARLHWLADQKIGHAQIRITPHDLGPIEVRIRLDGDRVSADFSSAQAEVRQALEASLPRLRDMLGAHGFQLAHADVGQQSRQDGAAARQHGGATGADAGAGASGEDGALQSLPASRGLVDAYA